MPSELQIDLIIKKLSGTLTKVEQLQLANWLNEDPENIKLFDNFNDTYQVCSSPSKGYIPDREKAWQKIAAKISMPQKKKYLISQVFRYAAASILFFIIGYSLQWMIQNNRQLDSMNQYSTVLIPEGQKSKVVLPDGSTVWLNSGSTLRYKNSFNKDAREVELEGEGYFEVKKDKSRLFRVNTGGINVEVYGTVFNVKNFTDEPNVEVTVKEGKVGFLKQKNKIIELIKNQQLSYGKETNRVRLVENANVEVITAWKNDELIFDSTPIEQVMKSLERWYGVRITIEEKMKNKHRYTFRVKTESFREMLELIKVITPLEYTINGKEVKIHYSN